jgi:hypothetical protein
MNLYQATWRLAVEENLFRGNEAEIAAYLQFLLSLTPDQRQAHERSISHILWEAKNGFAPTDPAPCSCQSCAQSQLAAIQAVNASIAEREASSAQKYAKKPISQKLRMAIFRRDGYKCKSCGSDGNLSVDHIHPEIEGGTLDPGNLQTLCRGCNSKKGSRITQPKAKIEAEVQACTTE